MTIAFIYIAIGIAIFLVWRQEFRKTAWWEFPLIASAWPIVVLLGVIFLVESALEEDEDESSKFLG